jgi:hypothetical protein
MKIISFCVYALLLLLSSFGAKAQISTDDQPADINKKQELHFTASSQFANSKFTYKIIPAANKTWCCDILVDGKMLIHQPSAAVFPGNKGFNTKASAQIVADLVIQKITNGEMPPILQKKKCKK